MGLALSIIGCFLAGFVSAAVLVGPLVGFFAFKSVASEAASICG